MQDKVTLNADMPGLKSVKAAGVEISFDQVTSTTTTATTDPKTGITTTVTNTKPGGLYVSEHVTARGEADKSRIKEGSAGVSGALATGALAVAAPGVGGTAVGLARP